MRRELMKVAGECDGLRCDMAMLVTPDVFRRTWGIEMRPFWPETIQTVRNIHPGFTFMAEVYWDLEWNLQPVVSEADVRRKHGVGGGVVQIVAHVSKVGASRFELFDDCYGLVQMRVAGVRLASQSVEHKDIEPFE